MDEPLTRRVRLHCAAHAVEVRLCAAAGCTRAGDDAERDHGREQRIFDRCYSVVRAPKPGEQRRLLHKNTRHHLHVGRSAESSCTAPTDLSGLLCNGHAAIRGRCPTLRHSGFGTLPPSAAGCVAHCAERHTKRLCNSTAHCATSSDRAFARVSCAAFAQRSVADLDYPDDKSCFPDPARGVSGRR